MMQGLLLGRKVCNSEQEADDWVKLQEKKLDREIISTSVTALWKDGKVTGQYFAMVRGYKRKNSLTPFIFIKRGRQ